MKSLYHEIIMDHYRNPRHWGILTFAQIATGLDNPSCGDSVEWTSLVLDSRVERIAFQGKGCVISLAAASLIAEWALGKSFEQIKSADDDLVQELLGTILGITRIKCALLPLLALQKGIAAYEQQQLEDVKEHHAGSSQISSRVGASE